MSSQTNQSDSFSLLKKLDFIKTKRQWLALSSIIFVSIVFLYPYLINWKESYWTSLSPVEVLHEDIENGFNFTGYQLRNTSDTIPRSRWRRVSWEDAVKAFSDQTSDSCNNTCDRSDNASDCFSFTNGDWNKRLVAGNFIVRPFLKDGMYIYEFEKEYLNYPPLEDMKQLPDMKLSKITMFGMNNDTVRCDIGDVINGRVDLVDSYDHPRHRGGDEVRMWLVSKSEKQFRTSGHVTDLNNGSYLLTGHCLWPGNIQINVAVMYPREYMRATMHQAQLSVSRYIYGNFIKNSTQETTICWSLPNVIGRSCVCNLTHLSGQSFYCGKPIDTRLTCNDFAATSVGPMTQPKNVTLQERDLIHKIPTRHILERTIPHSINVISEEKGQPPKLKPCSLTPFNVTWNLTSPVGYWGPNLNWTSLQCERPELSSPWAMSCLKNTTIMVFGDSNALRIFDVLSDMTNCTGVSYTLWPKAGTCSNNDSGITLSFTPHELPKYQHTYWTPKLDYKAVAEQISATPSVGKYIIIVHYYLHATPSHLSVVHSRIKSLAESIRHLARRNPDVLFVFRGPHVTSYDWDINHTIGGDSLGQFYLQLIQETFRDLRDKIVYLDGWGMTLAIENAELHPTDRVPQEMTRTLLSFRCNETGYVPR
ncbi:NXPE family member 1-like [Biomphalaria glabrata]|uniref:NXPE family member 1-like n=1 Tax=Biomphalaria glabrata TaxID=6526 RepID=A0A9W3AT55_BIOGL|nr:NXPE family member 1-like [Biomphalaria glabrata]